MKKLDKKLNLAIVINLIILFIFFFWFFTEIPLGRTWGTTKITTNNVIESFILLKRDKFFSRTLEKIEKVRNQEVKEKLLLTYIKLTRVTQWHDPVYPYQSKAVSILTNLYLKSQSWQKLRELAKKQTKIDPRNAYFYYLVALSYQKQNQIQKAKEWYYKTLAVDSLHLDAIKNLSQILIDEGEYYQVKKSFDHYLKTSDFISNEISFYWADDDFSEKTKINRKITSKTSEFSHHHIFLNNQIFKNAKNLTKFRIDPPQGTLMMNYIKINTVSKPIIYNNFSKWLLSSDIKRQADGSFIASGNDPYLYLNLPKPIPIENIKSIEVDFDYKKSIDPKIQELLAIVKSKI